MNNNPYLKQYKRNVVETATREDIFLLLFDSLIKCLLRAKDAMEKRQPQNLHNNIIKAQNILREFINTLDFSVNPELAENLKSLYSYHIQLLMKANIKRDVDALNEAYSLLFDLRDTWRKAINIYKNKQSLADIEDIDTSSDKDSDDDGDDDGEDDDRREFEG